MPLVLVLCGSIFLRGGRRFLEVTVYQNQVERALKVLKRQLTKDGLLKELKRRRFYEKPSVKKKRKQKEAKKKRKAAMRRTSFYYKM
jgi:small subunit ribosomal protein S21